MYVVIIVNEDYQGCAFKLKFLQAEVYISSFMQLSSSRQVQVIYNSQDITFDFLHTSK